MSSPALSKSSAARAALDLRAAHTHDMHSGNISGYRLANLAR